LRKPVLASPACEENARVERPVSLQRQATKTGEKEEAYLRVEDAIIEIKNEQFLPRSRRVLRYAASVHYEHRKRRTVEGERG
jgi:hypothetical protein